MRLLLFNLVTDLDDPVLGFTTSWIRELAKSVDAIDVITMKAGRVDVPGHVQVYSVGKEKGYSEFRRAREFYRILLALLARHHYDGCFAHMMPLFAVMAAPLLRIKKIPIVLWYAHKSVTWMLRMAVYMVNRVITASRESFRLSSDKVWIIGHGIDTDRFIPSADGDIQRSFTILSVGRLSMSKRLDLMLQAVALFRQQRPNLPLSVKIVGGPGTDTDRKCMEALKRQVERDSLSEVVEFVGQVLYGDIIVWYQQADCFVSLSETGAIDKAVLEAMSCGVPVIAGLVYADVLGPELSNIWLVAQDARQVCERLLSLEDMPVMERRRLGRQLREIVIRDHNLHTLCEKLFYEFRKLST